MTTLNPTTQALVDLGRGDRGAVDRLVPLVYEELRAIAAEQLGRERRDHTLQPTALAHEVYLRLVDQTQVDWRNRAHFLSVAARMVRRILVDHARARATGKRGGGGERVELGDSARAPAEDSAELLALDEALGELRGLDERQARVVELRWFGGLSVEETAHVLEVSARTVKGDWAIARAWLKERLAR